MSEANQRTLETYNSGVESYINGTVKRVDGEQQRWIDQILQSLESDSSILEIGSAFGRDASYIRDKGFNIDCSDASSGFVDYLNQHGFAATELNIIEEAPSGTYDLILACAVFLHFSLEDFHRALSNVRKGLEEHGRFAFSLKHGDGEEWSDAKMDAPRYFKYWREEELRDELAKAGFVVTDIQLLAQDKWLHVVAERAA